MLKQIVLLTAISAGGTLGWYAGLPMGLMGAYLSSTLGSAIGLYVGRRIQRYMDGE